MLFALPYKRKKSQIGLAIKFKEKNMFNYTFHDDFLKRKYF